MSRRSHHGSRKHARPRRPDERRPAGVAEADPNAPAPAQPAPEGAGPAPTPATSEAAADEELTAEDAAWPDEDGTANRPAPEPAPEPAAEASRGTVATPGPVDDAAAQEPADVPDRANGSEVAGRPAAPRADRPNGRGRPAQAPLVARLVQQQAARHEREATGERARASVFRQATSAETTVERVGPRPQDAPRQSCTGPQLRRFIKSRAYIPMHELRRRFGISGGEDEMTGVTLQAGRIYVGLPDVEGQMLGELLRSGDVGYELSTDPVTPVVIGVYAMRPVARG
jgi:hypothetical protein